jgi:hypothetical protein
LQGCPLSVILINLLTTVWKMAMDDTQTGFSVTEDSSPIGPPPPPPAPFDGTGLPYRLPRSRLPAKKRMAGKYAAGRTPVSSPKSIAALGYADDNYIISCSRPATNSSITLLEQWLSCTGQGVNPPKSHHLAVNMAPGTPPPTNDGTPVPSDVCIRSLGAPLSAVLLKLTPQLVRKRFASGIAVANRAANLPYNLAQTGRIIASAAIPIAVYGCEVAFISNKLILSLESACMRAIWGASHPCRASEIVLSLLLPGHTTSPRLSIFYRRVAWLARLARIPGTPQMLATLVLGTSPLGAPRGPLSRLFSDLSRYGWVRGAAWWVWTFNIFGRPTTIDLRSMDWEHLQHTVREFLRSHQWAQLSLRRPAAFAGIELGIARTATGLWIQRNSGSMPLEAQMLRCLMAGATWTAKRACDRRMRPSPHCPYCLRPEVEDTTHILWDCPSWSSTRDPLLSTLLAQFDLGRIPSDRRSWPVCFTASGIIPDAWECLSRAGGLCDLALCFHNMCVGILAVRAACDGKPCPLP